MKLQTKMYIAIAAAVLLALTFNWLWSDHRIAKLAGESRDAIGRAETLERYAVQKESEAAEYKQKIDYLERELGEIQQLARKQDEELEKLNSVTNNARADVEHARRTRSAAATADELCQKLAELGHGC